jgi:hypothetical protein
VISHGVDEGDFFGGGADLWIATMHSCTAWEKVAYEEAASSIECRFVGGENFWDRRELKCRRSL